MVNFFKLKQNGINGKLLNLFKQNGINGKLLNILNKMEFMVNFLTCLNIS